MAFYPRRNIRVFRMAGVRNKRVSLLSGKVSSTLKQEACAIQTLQGVSDF